MWKWVLNILAVLVLVFAVVYRMNYSKKDQNYDARSLGVGGGDFTLESNEQSVSLSDFKGRYVILYFGFTTCPDVCPMSLSYLNGALNNFKKKDEVQVIFISVDYQRDTPEKTAKYASFFNKDFIGLTGTQSQIDEITKNYNVYYKFIPMENSEMGYTVDHTSKFFILDKDGEVQKVVRSEAPVEEFLEVLNSVVE